MAQRLAWATPVGEHAAAVFARPGEAARRQPVRAATPALSRRRAARRFGLGGRKAHRESALAEGGAALVAQARAVAQVGVFSWICAPCCTAIRARSPAQAAAVDLGAEGTRWGWKTSRVRCRDAGAGVFDLQHHHLAERIVDDAHRHACRQRRVLAARCRPGCGSARAQRMPLTRAPAVGAPRRSPAFVAEVDALFQRARHEVVHVSVPAARG